MTYPPEVASNLAFFEAHGAWHVISTNPEVKGCVHAAANRYRLGVIGIPLFDELKSSVRYLDLPEGRRYVAAHCRGSQKLSFEKLNALLGAESARVPEEELTRNFGDSMGLVNPFKMARRPDVLQIFDETVMKPYFPPHTMMTNLGDHRYAVEFRPSDIVKACPWALVADIVGDDYRRIPIVHNIGILTGNGPESGMLLWQLLNEFIRDSGICRGDLSFPKVFTASLPEMGLSMELASREDAVRPVVLGGVRRLCESGATLVAIACNTTQIFADEVEAECVRYGARFIRTADLTAKYLNDKNIKSFDFLGIGAVADFGGLSGFGRALAGFDVHKPSNETLKKVDAAAYSVKRLAVGGDPIKRFRDLIQQTETDVVVLALTELSLIYQDQLRTKRSSKTIVDTLELVAQHLADLYVQEYKLALRPCAAEDEESGTDSD
jgi:aspartate/glutamate racemase/prolyl-tRNA editing enzyme YbaK/EbsC (Cys-tRNA(Pro) deacylase)